MNIATREIFLSTGTLALNAARLNHLDHLQKKYSFSSAPYPLVVEPGCGIGLLTGWWEDEGYIVLSGDILPDNVQFNKDLHPWRRTRVRVWDAAVPSGGKFHIGFVYGLLYHVADPALVLQNLSTTVRDILLVETIVDWKDGTGLNEITQWEGHDQGLAGVAYRPSRDWVEEQMTQFGFKVEIPDKQPQHEAFPDPKSWPLPEGTMCRSVFVGTR